MTAHVVVFAVSHPAYRSASASPHRPAGPTPASKLMPEGPCLTHPRVDLALPVIDADGNGLSGSV